MSIKYSEYVRQGKLTFRFYNLSGGAYGSNIAYDYGYFFGNKLIGMRYGSSHKTEIERDDDERDGIGSMTTTRESGVTCGSFISGKRNGFCYELVNGEPEALEFYEDDRELSIDDMAERVLTSLVPKAGENIYITPLGGLHFVNGELHYMGDMNEGGDPTGFGAYFDARGNLGEYGYLTPEGERMNFLFRDWEEMPVDKIDEDGFSVLRKMTYFDSGNLRYSITEGNFLSGKLSGLGQYVYNSCCNGYTNEKTEAGLFCDGKLVFGLNGFYESGSRGKYNFGNADGRDISEYGEEITYNGKRYVGETVDGVPNGIGCIFESETKMIKGTFRGGLVHGIGATYVLRDGEWVPFDYVREISDRAFSYDSWGIFAEGEFMPDMTFEEFYKRYGDGVEV